jgi:hypothetical protein
LGSVFFFLGSVFFFLGTVFSFSDVFFQISQLKSFDMSKIFCNGFSSIFRQFLTKLHQYHYETCLYLR